MEERSNDPQLELLAKIHNQLVDLTRLTAEIEMSKTTSEMLKTKLRQFVTSAKPVDAASTSAVLPRQQRVISPTDTTIETGESREK